MNLQTLEQLACEAEYRLHNRYDMGYITGLKATVLTVRRGESLETLLLEQRRLALVRDNKDLYDLGRIEAVLKTIEVTRT